MLPSEQTWLLNDHAVARQQLLQRQVRVVGEARRFCCGDISRLARGARCGLRATLSESQPWSETAMLDNQRGFYYTDVARELICIAPVSSREL